MRVTAWMRLSRTVSTPYDPGGEVEADLIYGEDPPEGKGWRPLYNERAMEAQVAATVSVIAERDALKAEVKRLRAVLKPFADEADAMLPRDSDREWLLVRLGDLRRARAALAEPTQTGSAP